MKSLLVLASCLALAACDNRSEAEKEYDAAMERLDSTLEQSEREIDAAQRGDTLTMTCLENAKSRKERRECTEY